MWRGLDFVTWDNGEAPFVGSFALVRVVNVLLVQDELLLR